MDSAKTVPQILSLSVNDRLRLLDVIWESVANESNQPEITEAQRQELERRWEDDEAHPDDVVPWEAVLAQARARWGR